MKGPIRLFRGENIKNLTPRQVEYRKFLATPLWDSLRRECYLIAGHKCKRCGGGGVLNAHHKFYPEKWEETNQGHLECVCQYCHAREHGFHKPKASLVVQKPKRQKKPKQSVIPIHEIKTLKELNTQRSCNYITRDEFLYLRRIMFPPKPPKQPERASPIQARIPRLTKKQRKKLAYKNRVEDGYQCVTLGWSAPCGVV